MEPIPAVSLGASPATSNLRSGTSVGGTTGMRSADGPDRATTGVDSRPADNQIAELFTLLQSLDGGENSRLLRMLVGLMILLALLQQMDGAPSQASSADPMGGGGMSGAEGIWMQTTSTSISLEQTSTTIVFGSATNGFDAAPAPELDSLGSHVDLSA